MWLSVAALSSERALFSAKSDWFMLRRRIAIKPGIKIDESVTYFDV